MANQTTFPHHVGEYLVATYKTEADTVVCRLKLSGDCPPGAVSVREGECLVAYSRLCPHMGCYLLPDPGKNEAGEPKAKPLPGKDIQDAALLRCQCHFSCFDLLARGLTVVGPATDWLAQMELKQVAGDSTKVELVGWRPHGDGRYGVPFGHTAPAPETASHAAAPISEDNS